MAPSPPNAAVGEKGRVGEGEGKRKGRRGRRGREGKEGREGNCPGL